MSKASNALGIRSRAKVLASNPKALAATARIVSHALCGTPPDEGADAAQWGLPEEAMRVLQSRLRACAVSTPGSSGIPKV